jgi:hypothetical protein
MEYHDVESYLAPDVGEVDVLRVNHHGSDHSSNSNFIAAVDPQAAIISVGNANTYGHARQATIDRLLGVIDGDPTRGVWLYMTERGDDGIGGCLTDYSGSDAAAANLYGQATIVSDTDNDYCTIEGGDVDVVVSADGSTFTVEGTAYTSSAGSASPCDGNGVCDEGEDCVNCPADCASTAAGSCGNGVCEPGVGEDCLSCANDCRGKQKGNPSNQFCCGAGGGTNPVGCGDALCTQDTFACSDTAGGSCCGDGTCSGPEDGSTCAVDCGQVPPDPPAACNDDGICDPGEDCTTCASDCAGQTNGRPADRYCCGNGIQEAREADVAVCDGNV